MQPPGQIAIILASLAPIVPACSSCPAQGIAEVQAFAGEPFGVGSVALSLPAELLPEPLGLEGVGVSEKSGRVFYPARGRRPWPMSSRSSSGRIRR